MVSHQELKDELKVTTDYWNAELQNKKVEIEVEVAQKFQELENKVNAMNAEILRLQCALSATEASERKAKTHEEHGLTSRRSFQTLMKFAGEAKEYPDWHFKMIAFLGEGSGGQVWIDVVTRLDKFTSSPTDKDLEELKNDMEIEHGPNINMAWINTQLYSVLVNNLTGNALKSIKGLQADTKTHGYVAWWKVGHESNAMTATKISSLADRIYSPKRAKNYHETNALVDEWEMHVKHFQEAENTKLSNQTMIHGLRQIVPLELSMDIGRIPGLSKYEKVREYVSEQVGLRKESSRSGPVPMDIGNVEKAKKLMAAIVEQEKTEDDDLEETADTKNMDEMVEELCKVCGDGETSGELKDILSFVGNRFRDRRERDGKGGKGGEKGGFDGWCSHCGKYGHRKRDCWDLDKIMSEWRAQKGKGDGKGKGGTGKGGWSQGKGGWAGVIGGFKGGKGGKGKGGKGAYSLGWDTGSSGQQGGSWGQQGGSWVFNLTSTGKNSTPKETTSNVPIALPPGLFEVLRMPDAEPEVNYDEKEYPKIEDGETQRQEKPRMPPMKNYSKNGQRRAKGANKGTKPLSMFLKTPDAKDLHPFVGTKPDNEGWVKIKGVMDSGASESVAPPNMCPHYEIRPSAGSVAGQKYMCASEETIDNLGEQELEVVTENGKESKILYQIADVARPLNAVSEICDAGGPDGQLVIFGKTGGVVYNLATGSQTPFGREEGIYCMDFWVKPRGFVRQG